MALASFYLGLIIVAILMGGQFMKNQRGFALVQLLLLLLIIGLIGGTGWYVWKANDKSSDSYDNSANSQNDPKKSDKKEAAEPETDPISNWVTYTNTPGIFTLKHPKTWATASKPELCSEGLVLFGGNSSSVGTCASEDGGQINVSSVEGNQDDEYALSADYYTAVSSEILAVDGIQGSRIVGTAKGQTGGDGPGGLPDGTKVVRYIFVANTDRTYIATYVQKSGYPDTLADFDTMVTKTLKFSI